MVRINRLTQGVTAATVLVKLETFNPGNSIKDRMAVKMIEEAEREGKLKPGGTIIEGTSGNTGMGLAITAIVKGYKCIFTTTDKQSKEKIDALKAFGAEVIVCPTDVDPEDPRSYYSVSSRLEREIPNAWKANQYDNLANTQAHYEQTGPEIWEQTGGRVTHLVVGVGTGGTVTGVGSVLKERLPGVRVIGVEPARSPVLSGGRFRPHGIQGIGASFVPGVLDRAVLDEVITVRDEDATATARRLGRDEGLLVGISSGANVWAACQVAESLPADQVVVTVLCDTGERYLSVTF